MEVFYFLEGGFIIDYVCDIFGIKVGVFVICVMKYWGEYMEEDVMNFFIKKLKGIYILYK